ncbi:MAG: YitT family protein [Anaerolineales bacterium]|nr:YitT family protein [Anaerolineales bacterium]
MKKALSSINNTSLDKNTIRDYFLILLGSSLQAIALRIFLIPAKLAGGGVSGLSQIINNFTSWPIGLMVFVGNIPLFILGWRFLGGPKFAARTAFAIIVFSLLVDIPVSFFPRNGITDDIVLNALYGGVVSGIGFGLVYRGRGTSGGSDILARILSRWRGIPVTQSYLLTDAIIIFLAGISFSWENALYALVMLYVSGIAAESISQGSNILRTGLIITVSPDLIVNEIFSRLGRGVTVLDGRGGYSGETKTILLCVVTRAEIPHLKALTRELDPKAFLIIGQAHEVRGEGFLPMGEE